MKLKSMMCARSYGTIPRYRPNPSSVQSPRRKRGAGFTLVEILVALALMTLLLTIVFVPLNQAFTFFGIGQSRTKLQQASRQTLSQIESDLKRAIYVYPNDVLPSVTNKEPFNGQAPYYETATEAGNTGAIAAYDVCAAAARGISGRVGNVSRIDMLMPDVDASGQVLSPIVPGNYLVTYYARRLHADRDYDNTTNPIVWFRAQMPFRRNDTGNKFRAPEAPDSSTVPPPPPFNVETASNRYLPSGSCSPDDSRGSRWLIQDKRREPNLEPLSTTDAPSTVPGTHTLALPRGMSLIAPGAGADNYQPDSSFVLEDINRDGKIDQVTVNLALEQYDTATVGNTNGNKPKSTDRLGVQRVRDSITVSLPNVD